MRLTKFQTWLMAFWAGCLLTLPAFGTPARVQTVSATTGSASSLSATITLTAGNLMIVDWYEGAVLASIPISISDNQGDVFFLAVGPGKSYTFYCPSVHGGSTTVTMSSPGTTTAFDLVLTEVSGVSGYLPLFAKTMGQITSTNIEANLTSLVLPTGSYYLYSRTADNTSGSTYTPSAGWASHAITGNSIHNTFDQTVTSGTYDITITSTASLNASGDNDTKFPFLAFSTTPAIRTPPTVVQYGTSGSFLAMSTSQAFMPVSVTVGNYLVAFGNGNGGGSYTISDSQHNTWTLLEGGGGGNSYGMWVTTASATGEEDVTIVGGASPSLEVWEIANTAGVDVHNSAETATIGGSISASITTTHTNDYVLEIQSTQSGCNTGGATYSTDSGFTWLSWTASHCSFGQGYEGVAPTTATFTSGASSGPGLMSVGVIAMKPAVAGVTSTQPVVNVIQ